MCLTSREKKIKYQIAEEGITCYKVVYANRGLTKFMARFWSHIYDLGVEQPKVWLRQSALEFPLLIDMYNKPVPQRVINKGYHSYVDYKDAVTHYDPASSFKHGDTTTLKAIVKCTIPKGAKYAIGFDNSSEMPSYVSNTIIIDEVVDRFEYSINTLTTNAKGVYSL